MAKEKESLYNSTLIHYDEIALKGKNRRFFENQLIQNVRRAIGQKIEVRHEFGRLYIPHELPPDQLTAVSRLFGLSWLAPATRIPPQISLVKRPSLNQVAVATKSKKVKSFSVRARRASKGFPLNSQEIEREIGQLIKDQYQLQVDLENPDLTVYIDITSKNAFTYTQKLHGPGGLPAGSSGKVVGLFSGGLDSALSAYLIGQRGCRVHLLHIHVLDDNEEVKKTKIWTMAQRLSSHYPGLKLTLIRCPFGEATADLPPHLERQRLIAFRRYIMRCAQELAKREGYDAVVSGDSLGQVASQTMSNLAAVNGVGKLPIFRPLIGLNKNKINQLGEEIGLCELANQEYKDCCSIIAQNPGTKADFSRIEQIEELINIEKLVKQSLAAAETFRL